MTPAEKQKCIAEQAVYGDLHFVNPSGNVRKLDVVSSIVAYNGTGAIFTPILRPLSDLTKEITHKGYNDDKPFVPLVEILSLTEKMAEFSQFHDHNSESSIEYIVNVDWGNGTERCTYRFGYSHDLNRFYKTQVSPFRKPFGIPYQQQMFDMFHLWHFDTRNLISQGEAIDVNTLRINPYKV